jgi:hypothetical protein
MPAARSQIVVLACLLLLGATGCARRAEPVTVEEVLAGQGPAQETWEPALFISEEGEPRLHVRAPYMATYETPDSTYMLLTGLEDGGPSRVEAVIFDTAGDTSAVVLADRLYYYDQNLTLEARGGVRVRTANGRRLESEHLLWSESDRQVRTPGFARIEMPDRILQGYGLVADEDLGNVRLADVTGTVILSDE